MKQKLVLFTAIAAGVLAAVLTRFFDTEEMAVSVSAKYADAIKRNTTAIMLVLSGSI